MSRPMWILQQPSAGCFVQREIQPPDPAALADGEILVKFLAGSICGSDIPKFLGHSDPDNPHTGQPGVPLHELVGEVVASRAHDLHIGQRVVGNVTGARGLSEYVTTRGDWVVPIAPQLDDVSATLIQPLATAMSALNACRDPAGVDAVVLGLGPLGLILAHLLKCYGAKRVEGVDYVDRAAVAAKLDIDASPAHGSGHWACHVRSTCRPALVIDAVGHNQQVLADAIEGVAPGGEVYLFGLPEDHYVVPMRRLFRKRVTLKAGATQHWQRFLRLAHQHLLRYPELSPALITDLMPVSDAASAYQRCAVPAPGRLKIVLVSP